MYKESIEIKFSEEELQRIQKIKTHYPAAQSALMPVLWMAQKKFRWLSEAVISYISELLDLTYSHVLGVATFYTMYYKKPMGKYHIQVCTNVSCMINDGDKIYEYVCNKLGIGHNQCTTDGVYSLEEVECMGACGGAPMVAVNEDYFENISIEELDKLIDSLK